MLLIDTSVWVEFFRGNPPPGLRELLTDQLPEVATTEPIVMEVLAGATDDRAVRQLETLVNGLVLLPVDAARDYHDAAAIYRAARRRGQTVRKLVDCLIAAVAIRRDATVIHRDRDFEVISAVAPLRARFFG